MKKSQTKQLIQLSHADIRNVSGGTIVPETLTSIINIQLAPVKPTKPNPIHT